MVTGTVPHAAAKFVARAKSLKAWKSLQITMLLSVISVSFDVC